MIVKRIVFLIFLSDVSSFNSVQSLSHVWLFAPHGLQQARPPCPSPTPRVYSNSCPLSQWGYPTTSSSVIPFSSIFPSIKVFSNELVLLIRWPKYWSFSWLDLLVVQRTLKSLLQHHSSKTSILQHSTIFIVQISHSYMTTGKMIALTIWTFVGKVMSLLLNMLSRFVNAFLPRS